MERQFKRTPPRLTEVFRDRGTPVYFITICTLNRQPILANEPVYEAFQSYAMRGGERGAFVGRYVIMPDHVHVFVSLSQGMTVGRWVNGLKRCLNDPLRLMGNKASGSEKFKLSSFWQPDAFDHLLRSAESYEQKWQYVLQNPVRAGLVKRPEDWPFQGEVVALECR